MFVARLDGVIYGVWTVRQAEGQEELADDNAEVLAFLNPAPTAEQIKAASIEAAIRADTTLAALKAMDASEFDTWWAANVTTAAQAIAVLKRLARVIIRRLL